MVDFISSNLRFGEVTGLGRVSTLPNRRTEMENFVRRALNLVTILVWSVIILKQFVTLIRWLALFILSVWGLIALIKALLACFWIHRRAATYGGVLFYEKDTCTKTNAD